MSEQNTVYDVVGIGNAIVDVLAKVGDTFLKERNLTKGCMTLVEAAEAGKIYNDIIPEREVSGGSAANTVAGMASLGADCAFIGKVHDDELGQVFKRDIGAAGIDCFTSPLEEGPATGRSIVLVTPDAQRSMFTYLGASRKLSVEDIDEIKAELIEVAMNEARKEVIKLLGGVISGMNVGQSVVRPSTYIKDEENPLNSGVLWNCMDLGYLAVQAAYQLSEGTITTDSTSIEAGRVGTKEIVDRVCVLGDALVFDGSSVDQYDY